MELKILFIHNKAKWYRISLFNRLADEFDITYVFTNEHKVEGLNAEYIICKRYGIYPFSVSFSLMKVLFNESFDLVVFPPSDSPGELVDNILCLIISKLKNKPYIIWSERWSCSEVKSSYYKVLYKYVDKLILKYLCKNASVNLASGGTKQKEYFTSLGVPVNKIYNIPYLSDVPFKQYKLGEIEQKKQKIIKDLGIKDGKVILCVARLVKRKGIDYLIRVFAEIHKDLDNVSLVIVGGYDYSGREKYYGKELQKLCIELGVDKDVYFIGHVNSKDLPPYYLLCNLLVFPSIAEKFADTGCLPVSDAMYFGKPVVSTDVVGFAHDLIKNNINGYLVPQKDINSLSVSIRKIIQDEELEKQMGIESKKLMNRKFSADIMVENFKKAIDFAMK